MINRHAALVLLALLVLLVATCRSRSHPASGSDRPGGAVYVPIASQGAPRCNRWRGDDWWPCVEATLTSEARVSSTPRPTSTPTRASATWAPGPYEPMGRAWLPILADVAGPGILCSAAPAGPRTVWLADHCLGAHPWRLTVNGLPVTSWLRDAGGRDLAQLEAAGGWPVPTLARLALGDRVVMRPARGPVGGTYAGDAWADRSADGYAMTTFARPGTQPVGAVCVDPGQYIRMGDSGAGVYLASDGGLGAIVVAAEAWAADQDVWCGGGQVAVVVSVP